MKKILYNLIGLILGGLIIAACFKQPGYKFVKGHSGSFVAGQRRFPSPRDKYGKQNVWPSVFASPQIGGEERIASFAKHRRDNSRSGD